MGGWIGVDLDGTLAMYDEWIGPEHIGEPIAPMTERVLAWLGEGRDVRIFTARVFNDTDGIARGYIEAWSERVFGVRLPITCTKDYEMTELWDDRAVQIITNTGRRADGK